MAYLLGDYQTNNKSVEIQIFRKFLRDQFLNELAVPTIYCENFEEIFNRTESDRVAASQVDSKSVLRFYN